jgi:hypothetical protein
MEKKQWHIKTPCQEVKLADSVHPLMAPEEAIERYLQ